MLTSPFSNPLCNRCLICWRLSFGWEREILASGEKRPLIPNVSSQQESRWLSSIRLKAQRTAASFVTLEEERDHFEIRKSVATTHQGQYEIGWDIKLFWVLTVHSVGYGFRVWVFQVAEGTTPQKTLISLCKHKSPVWTERLTVSWLSIDKSHPLSQAWHPALHPAEPLCFSQVPQPDKLYPPQTLSPWTSALNYSNSFTAHKKGGEQGPFSPWSFSPSKHKTSLVLKYKKELWEEFTRAQDTLQMQHIFLLLLYRALLVTESRVKPLLPLGKAWAGITAPKEQAHVDLST